MAARSEIIPAAANFTDPCKTTELQLDQAFCSQVRMNASSRIKVDNELRAEPESLRCCTRITGEDSRIFAFFCGSIIARRAHSLITAKALSSPMAGPLYDGSFSVHNL